MSAEHWEDQTATESEARWAVWAEPDWEAGIEVCLDAIAGPLRPILDAGGTVLDVGCGIARLLAPLARLYPQATLIGLDRSAGMIELAQRATARLENVVLFRGAVETVRGLALDGFYSVVVLQHLDAGEQLAYLTALAGALRPGGLGVFQIVTHTDPGPLSNPVDTATAARWCADQGLDVVAIRDGHIYPEWAWLTVTKEQA